MSNTHVHAATMPHACQIHMCMLLLCHMHVKYTCACCYYAHACQIHMCMLLLCHMHVKYTCACCYYATCMSNTHVHAATMPHACQIHMCMLLLCHMHVKYTCAYCYCAMWMLIYPRYHDMLLTFTKSHLH